MEPLLQVFVFILCWCIRWTQFGASQQVPMCSYLLPMYWLTPMIDSSCPVSCFKLQWYTTRTYIPNFRTCTRLRWDRSSTKNWKALLEMLLQLLTLQIMAGHTHTRARTRRVPIYWQKSIPPILRPWTLLTDYGKQARRYSSILL